MSHTINHAAVRSEELLAGRYRLIKPVGQGGYGTVYEAADTLLHRRVAVKEISLRGVAPDQLAAVIATVKREVALLSRLSHPRIPRLFDYFVEADTFYLVMEFVEGLSLADDVQRNGGRLPIDRVIDIGRQVCEVLEYLHHDAPGAPIIYRDMKPENLMITVSGQISLVDFGIARHFKPGKAKDTFPLGSRGYAAPEQYGGQTSPQSDFYALGATLLSLLTGIDPCEVPLSRLALGCQPSQVLCELWGILMQMVDRFECRPRSATEVKQRLQQCAWALSPRDWTVLGLRQAPPPGAALYPAQQQRWQSYGARRTDWPLAVAVLGQVAWPHPFTWPPDRRWGNGRRHLPSLGDMTLGMGLLLGAVLIVCIGLFAGMALVVALH